jgi:hypothetical protein
LEFLYKLSYQTYLKYNELKTEEDLDNQIKNLPENLFSKYTCKEYREITLKYIKSNNRFYVFKIIIVQHLILEILNISFRQKYTSGEKIINYHILQKAISSNDELQKIFNVIDKKYFGNYNNCLKISKCHNNLKSHKIHVTVIKKYFPDFNPPTIEFLKYYIGLDFETYNENEFQEVNISKNINHYLQIFKNYYKFPEKITFKILTDIVLSKPMIPILKKLRIEEIKTLLNPNLIPDLQNIVLEYL